MNKEALTVFGTALVVLMLAGLSEVFAPSPAFASDPPGDCWQGALSHDPQHCLVLEALQREGTVEVDGIYRASDDWIYVYLSKPKPEEGARTIFIGDYETERIEKATSDVLKAKLAELVAQSPDSFNYDHWAMHVCVFRDENDKYDADAVIPYADAGDTVKAKYRECMANSPPWAAQWMSLGLAWSGDVVLVLAEAETRKQVTGWASWTALWPLDSSGLAREAVDYTGPFDVSGVDMENIPTICEMWPDTDSCYRSQQHPNIMVVGMLPGSRSKKSTQYVQIVDPPEGAEAIAAVKEAVAALWIYTADQIEFVPVEHSMEVLHRGRVLLERFAESSGNTLGISRVAVAGNGGYNDESVYLHGYQSPGRADVGGVDFSTVRTFIVLWAPDAQSVADALPQLLRQLDIPYTAVGMVRDTHPETSSAGRRSGSGAASESAVDSAREYVLPIVGENRPWVFAAAGIVGVVLAGGGFVVVRRVRRRRYF